MAGRTVYGICRGNRLDYSILSAPILPRKAPVHINITKQQTSQAAFLPFEFPARYPLIHVPSSKKLVNFPYWSARAVNGIGSHCAPAGSMRTFSTGNGSISVGSRSHRCENLRPV